MKALTEMPPETRCDIRLQLPMTVCPPGAVPVRGPAGHRSRSARLRPVHGQPAVGPAAAARPAAPVATARAELSGACAVVRADSRAPGARAQPAAGAAGEVAGRGCGPQANHFDRDWECCL